MLLSVEENHYLHDTTAEVGEVKEEGVLMEEEVMDLAEEMGKMITRDICW